MVDKYHEMKWVCKSIFSTRAQMCLFDTVRTMYICKYIIYTVNTYTQFHSLKPCGVWDRHVFAMMDVFVLRIAAKQSDVVIVDSCGQYGYGLGPVSNSVPSRERIDFPPDSNIHWVGIC